LLRYNGDMTSRKSEPASVLDTRTSADRTDPRWELFVDEFFDQFFRFNPSKATDAGFHEYDGQLEDYSRQGVQNEIAFAKKYLGLLQEFHPKSWPLQDQQDHQLIVLNLKSTLLGLENIRSWEKNADLYTTGISQSAFVIVARSFAPLEQRLETLIQREQKMPAALAAGKENLDHPPRLYTEVAIEQLPGIIDFFQKDVPRTFGDVKNQRLMSEFRRVNSAVIDALRDFEGFLRESMLSKSDGDFRIGAENYAKKLLYDEMIDTPLERLLQLGYADLHRNQQTFEQVARQINANKTPQRIMFEQQENHPEPDCLLQAFREELSRIQRYVVERQIVTLPSFALPTVTETPPFARALTFASMDTPGPFEKVATEAFFNVTLPEKHWSKAHTQSFMGQFNKGTITSTAIHEVLPGHYAQFLWLSYAPSKVRKLLGCDSNSEGWAHYCEQMLLDEGYGDGDPKLRLGQLQDALLRNARYIVGISMHTGDMTFESAVQFFQDAAYLSESEAGMEARRGTSDPTYLVYTLGKLEILRLRNDYRMKMGSKFNLRQFHDSFLQQGFPPLKIVRETLLGDESPTVGPAPTD
jgi:uncharacterized protein (DUF885 family)